jgi:uncharacterized protein YceH (UPF0502 family)
MTNDATLPSADVRYCLLCKKPLASDAQFCPSCGTRVIDPTMLSTVDVYIRSRLDDEIAKRFVDQNTIAREIGDKAEDTLWKRLRAFGVLMAVIVAVVGFAGYKTVTDVTQTIVRDTAGNVDAVKGQLGQLSKEIDAQTKRVSEKGGEITERLSGLDAAANDAQAKAEAYLKRADELATAMNQRLAALDSKVAQVSTQVDNVSVRQEYPDLGRAKIVTYKGGAWKKDDKKPGEKWIGIYIFPYANADFTGNEIENLVRDLRAAGYTPLLGMFGIGGPYNTGMGPLGDNISGSSLYYFSKSSEPMSAEVRAVVLKDLPVKSLDASYVAASDMSQDDQRRFVIENAGLDLQLVLRPLIR